MSVNDVSACGAVPLFFLDYLVVGKVEPAQGGRHRRRRRRRLPARPVRAARRRDRRAPRPLQRRRRLRPGRLRGRHRRAAPSCGGPTRVEAGDALVGIASNGLHSNGSQLVRAPAGRAAHRPRRRSGPRTRPPAGAGRRGGRRHGRRGAAHADDHLQPGPARPGPRLPVHAAAHITGGGFPDNVGRILPDGAGGRARPLAPGGPRPSLPGCTRLGVGRRRDARPRSTAASAWSWRCPAGAMPKALATIVRAGLRRASSARSSAVEPGARRCATRASCAL